MALQLLSKMHHCVAAKMKSKETKNKLRKLEGALTTVRSSKVCKLREENKDLCKQLAFVEGGAEDYRNKLNAERDRHREKVEELRGDVNVLATKLRQREEK